MQVDLLGFALCTRWLFHAAAPAAAAGPRGRSATPSHTHTLVPETKFCQCGCGCARASPLHMYVPCGSERASAREATKGKKKKKKKKRKKGREKMQCDNRLRLPRTHHRLSPKLTRAVFLSSFFVDGQVGPTPPTALHAVWW
ncbi:uncharacterized protein IWZ02DRAFT_90133 [Phyllosticta citriasiana]|uniref:uncharacterized protein n=1 Tax=Phyllosticta citriasiana TaxID=595635 RepID=UPI0030FD63DA